MVKRFRILFAIALVPLLLISCKKEEQPQPVPVKKAQPARPAQAPQTIDITAPAEPSIGLKQRNPFLSYLVLLKGVEGAKKIKGPLECCELNQFKLVAVVVSSERSSALVQAPDSKRYIVKVGDIMGARDGRIVKIEDRSITVREYARDDAGKVTSSADIEIRLPEKESESQKK